MILKDPRGQIPADRTSSNAFTIIIIFSCRIIVFKCVGFWHTVMPLYTYIWLCWVLAVACRIFRCGMWDLVPWPGLDFGPLALGIQSLSQWITRDVPSSAFYLVLWLEENLTWSRLQNDHCLYGPRPEKSNVDNWCKGFRKDFTNEPWGWDLEFKIRTKQLGTYQDHLLSTNPWLRASLWGNPA